MKKSKLGYLIIAALLCWSLALLLLFPAICLASEAEKPQTMTMSIEQFQSLKTVINEQEALLLELEKKLSLLEQTTPELSITLKEQQELLIKVQKQLANAELSLTEAEIVIDEQNKSLQILSKQIKKQQDINKRQQMQKTFWGFLGGMLFISVVK